MSIGSVQSNPWSDPWAQSASAQPGSNASGASSSAFGITLPAQGSFGSPPPVGPWSNQGSSTTGGAAANPLQSLANDIQAMLIQAQTTAAGQTSGSAASTATSGPSTTGGTQAVSPEQQVATDLQTLMSDLQASAANAPNAQTASTNAADPTSQTQSPHHHHHHHEGGGEASGASAVAGSPSASATATAGSTAANGDDQQVSQVFAADIEQALQAYSGASALTATPSLTV